MSDLVYDLADLDETIYELGVNYHLWTRDFVSFDGQSVFYVCICKCMYTVLPVW
jgi:hypothetical protein